MKAHGVTRLDDDSFELQSQVLRIARVPSRAAPGNSTGSGLTSEPGYEPLGYSGIDHTSRSRQVRHRLSPPATTSDRTRCSEPARRLMPALSRAAEHWRAAAFTSLAYAMIMMPQMPNLAAAAPTHLYVATTGSDSSPGTVAAPYRTLQKAASVATPGTTVHVATGTYNDKIYCSIPGIVNGTTAVCMRTSGTPTAPITFISDTIWGAKLTCQQRQSFFTLAASYIVVSGFDMSCPAGNFAGGTYGDNGHNTFTYNYIHDISIGECNATAMLFGSDYDHSDWTNIGYNVFDHNVLHHGGSPTSSYPTCELFHGIYIGDPYSKATYNMVSGMVGYGIHAYGGGVCHQTIDNNIVFDNSKGGIVIRNTTQYGTDLCKNGGKPDYETVTNNVVANNGYGNGYSGAGGGINLKGPSGSNNRISDNIVFGNYNFQAAAASPTVVKNTLSGSNTSTFKNYRADKNWAPVSSYNYLDYMRK